MPEIQCACGQLIHYADDVRGALSCPHCGERLGFFGPRPAAPSLESIEPQEALDTDEATVPHRLHSADESARRARPREDETPLGREPDLPAPLGDPLRVYRYLMVGLMAFMLLLLVAHVVAAVVPVAAEWEYGPGFARLSAEDRVFVVVVTSIPLLFVCWFCFAIWQILPARPVNAFYLRSFANDRATLLVRQDAQNALGRNFRLSGIRDPRRRWPPFIRWILSIILVFRYCTPKYMNLEAGRDWKARLWRSLGGARCALIDVSRLTTFVEEEIELCVRCLGVERVLFVGDAARDEEGWRDQLRRMLPGGSSAKKSINVAIWNSTREGRKQFRESVALFADRLPEGTAGLSMDALPLTTNESMPNEKTDSSAIFGWIEVVVGFVLATAVFFLIGLLPGVGDAGKFSHLAIVAAFGALFFWSFVCYLIDCGPGRRRWTALVTIGGPFFCQIVLVFVLVPAAQQMKAAAERTLIHNNLRQVDFAFRDLAESRARRLPAAAAYYTADGKPGLSWRVALLPHIEQAPLFSMFHLDEPWDSPHNVKLLPRMPRVYAVPSLPDEAEKGLTRYQVFVGAGTPFPPSLAAAKLAATEQALFDPFARRPRLVLGPDRSVFPTLQTILVALADTPVPWTKPADMEFAPDAPLPWRPGNRGGQVLFADGIVQTLPPEMEEVELRRQISPYSQQKR